MNDGLVLPPRTGKGRATRDRIVDVAASVMYVQGVAGTSTEQIQQQAGISASQLYHYFTSKQDLVQAVVSKQMDVVLAAQEPHLSSLRSVASLRAYRDHMVSMQLQADYLYGCPIGLLTCELANPGSPAREPLIAAFEAWESPVREGIRHMRDHGELSTEADPATLARAFTAAIQGGLLLARAHQNSDHLHAALTSVIDYIATFQNKP